MKRKPRKRGSKATKRGISNQQICVLWSKDRSGHIFSDIACNGRISTKIISNLLSNKVSNNVILCTDEHRSYVGFAETKNIRLYQIKGGKGVIDEIYHIQNINFYHSRLKPFLSMFKGVATKYLAHYLTYFKWFELNKHETLKNKATYMFSISGGSISKIKVQDFKEIKPIFYQYNKLWYA